MISSINYNSISQVVSSISPDAGLSEFLYREDGQIRYSQNAQQKASNANPLLQKFSYTNYDAYGRVIEMGEYDPTASGSASPLSFAVSNIDQVLDEIGRAHV